MQIFEKVKRDPLKDRTYYEIIFAVVVALSVVFFAAIKMMWALAILIIFFGILAVISYVGMTVKDRFGKSIENGTENIENYFTKRFGVSFKSLLVILWIIFIFAFMAYFTSPNGEYYYNY